MTPDDAAIEACIVALLARRAADATICPSEVARALVTDEAGWRGLMPRIRAVAGAMADAGRLRVTQRGVVVDARTATGPIRLGRRPVA